MMEVPVIPENAPFSREQRLWLNGFLAGYFSRRPLVTVPEAPAATALKPPLRILFGSQTGTAQNVAKRLAKEAAARGFRPEITDGAEHGKIVWSEQRNLLVVTSTYGDGDMPDNLQGFWEWLSSKAAPSLKHLSYSVLALGDRNYSEFCAAGKKIDCRLEELGASRVHPRSDCDADYEATAQNWIAGVLKALGERNASLANATPNAVAPESAKAIDVNASLHRTATEIAAAAISRSDYSRSNPFGARLLKNLSLSKPGSGKEVRHYEISLQGSGLNYEPGDALGVWPLNCPELVGELLALLKCTGDELTQVRSARIPLRDALLRHLDISKPSRELLHSVARCAPESELSTLLEPERREDLKTWLWGKGVIDVLLVMPSAMPATELVAVLSPLAPRLYSIASSPKAHPGEVHLTVNTVRYQSCGRERKGVASTFLADRVTNEEAVNVFVQRSHGFKVPSDRSRSMIMVGPGTGVAPFRAFLEERETEGASGKHWLFFGDQKRQTDFLYEDQLNRWLSQGHLTRMDLAFSRDQADKLYVQHRMLENAGELWAWLEDGAHFYVCGDAARMAKDVDAALHQVAEKAGGLDRDGAKSWVAKLKTEKRYQRDVY